jgi:hypothetical protein
MYEECSGSKPKSRTRTRSRRSGSDSDPRPNSTQSHPRLSMRLKHKNDHQSFKSVISKTESNLKRKEKRNQTQIENPSSHFTSSPRRSPRQAKKTEAQSTTLETSTTLFPSKTSIFYPSSSNSNLVSSLIATIISTNQITVSSLEDRVSTEAIINGSQVKSTIQPRISIIPFLLDRLVEEFDASNTRFTPDIISKSSRVKGLGIFLSAIEFGSSLLPVGQCFENEHCSNEGFIVKVIGILNVAICCLLRTLSMYDLPSSLILSILTPKNFRNILRSIIGKCNDIIVTTLLRLLHYAAKSNDYIITLVNSSFNDLIHCYKKLGMATSYISNSSSSAVEWRSTLSLVDASLLTILKGASQILKLRPSNVQMKVCY